MSSNTASGGLPCVVHVGFAGARKLFDPTGFTSDEQNAVREKIYEVIKTSLVNLPDDLGLTNDLCGKHFFCGISQLAVGADMLFTQACRSLDIPQRIFLPQPRESHFLATGSDGEADFSKEEKREAEGLLESPHIIQEKVVSNASRRRPRFTETNLEILRAVDVLICVILKDAPSNPGGTAELSESADRRGVPTLKIYVETTDGTVNVETTWSNLKRFAPPSLPILDTKPNSPHRSLPSVSEFTDAVGREAGIVARTKRDLFARMALVIISTHLLATFLSTVVLAFHPPVLSTALLVLEILALTLGFIVHLLLHRNHLSKSWALSRLLAEINRSVRVLGALHIDLDYLFRLHLPKELKPLLSTLETLHLRSTSPIESLDWQILRDNYLSMRLTDPDKEQGQIAYYRKKRDQEKRRMSITNRLFRIFTIGAVSAVIAKLIAMVNHDPSMESSFLYESRHWFSAAAIVLPVFAVGVLSWTAANDYEARVHTFGAMADFLQDQVTAFKSASSESEVRRLVEQTETELLKETVEWYNRRTFAGVA